MIARRAPAKLNLSLEVLGRRPDGYHELVSVVQTIDLADTLTFRPAEEVTLSCSDADLAGHHNLVCRAAHMLREAAGVTGGAHIHLDKRIPVAAGLGGGSSDAAAALLGLCELWGMSLPEGDLAGLARRLGADVPFLLRGGTALMEGVGELLTPLPSLPTQWAVLAVPPVAIPHKTATLYGRLRPAHYTDGSRTRALVDEMRQGAPLDPALMGNAFEAVLTEEPVTAARRAMLAAGAPWVRLSGSGPSLFCLFDAKEDASRVYQALKSAPYSVFLTATTAVE